jgi:hypothetical protein
VAKKISKAEARRRASAIRANKNATEPLITGENLRYLLNFRATMTPEPHREAVRAAVVDICGRALHITGKAAFAKLVSDVSTYAGWKAAAGGWGDWQDLMDHRVIHDFGRAAHPGSSDASHAERVKRLRRLASTINPGESAPPHTPSGHRTRIKPPYTPKEDAAHLRVVISNTGGGMADSIRLALGLSRGAGASNADLRRIQREHIIDAGTHGIDVRLGAGATERVVPLLREYEHVVRAGLASAPENGPLFGRGGKNAINEVVRHAGQLSNDVDPPEVSRLRTTWIATQMQRPLPLGTLMAAAGLQGARTFGDIYEVMQHDGQSLATDFGAMR